MHSEAPLLAITMGDAGGIGPEIILKSLASYQLRHTRPIVIGRQTVFSRAAATLKSPLSLKRVRDPDEAEFDSSVVNILEIDKEAREPALFGVVSSISGKDSVEAIRVAHKLSLSYPVRAIVSAPLNKRAISEAGFEYADECDLMSELTGAETPMMLLISDKMRLTTLCPLHVSLRRACDNVSAKRVQQCLTILNSALIALGVPKPVIAVAALNPHAGEGGLLGEEEVREIVPAVTAARESGMDVWGPLPADSLFFRASKGEFDAVLSMYHDQGRIAMKASDFGRIKVMMIGIPTPFLTVAHGTAYDIAGRGLADSANFEEVLKVADGLSSS